MRDEFFEDLKRHSQVVGGLVSNCVFCIADAVPDLCCRPTSPTVSKVLVSLVFSIRQRVIQFLAGALNALGQDGVLDSAERITKMCHVSIAIRAKRLERSPSQEVEEPVVLAETTGWLSVRFHEVELRFHRRFMIDAVRVYTQTTLEARTATAVQRRVEQTLPRRQIIRDDCRPVLVPDAAHEFCVCLSVS